MQILISIEIHDPQIHCSADHWWLPCELPGLLPMETVHRCNGRGVASIWRGLIQRDDVHPKRTSRNIRTLFTSQPENWLGFLERVRECKSKGNKSISTHSQSPSRQCVILAIVIWACLDPSSILVPPSTAPWLIGFA